jgi:hypothetical protein
MTERYIDRVASRDEFDAALAEDPSNDLTPPNPGCS